MNRLKGFALVLGLLAPFSRGVASQPKLYEMPRTQVIPILDSASNRPYELYIKLPEGYADNLERNYPVVYFTDAKWHIEILSASTEYLMKNVILVGISWQTNLKLDVGEHVSRFRDYSNSKSNHSERQEKYQFGQADQHLKFIKKDVFEYIEKHYRANPKGRSYFGYSLGALFGAYILLVQPDTFENYILGSPNFNQDLMALEERVLADKRDLKVNVFISVGELEKSYIKPIELFVEKIRKKEYPSLVLDKYVIKDSDHGTAFPETALRSIRWLSKIQGEGEQK